MQRFTQTRQATTPDEVWVVEHPPVYTLGQAGNPAHLINPTAIPLVKTDRGGQITYHGPGQVVVYPLLNLARYGLKVREYVHLLEQVLIDCLADQGLTDAQRKPGAPGVYVGWNAQSQRQASNCKRAASWRRAPPTSPSSCRCRFRKCKRAWPT
ncbi:MAG: lipoyl(octanoyl) transferase LipB [Limnobacter sp.]|nr:lipoyl(octanoyl) transferase LipB [Limnobacter sp.]